MQLTIRRATSSDTDGVAELYLRARREAADAGSIPALAHGDADVREWAARLVIPRLECWLVERRPNGVVGMLVLNENWIEQLYVDPELTRCGIGAELMALAKRRRPKGLRLWTFVSNDGAQRFYLHHGFQEVERTDGSGNEEGAPDILYSWAPI
jgi:GNAT superfamily N-acetyltransferase